MQTKNDRVAKIQKSLLPVRKMVISTVKNGRLHYFFSPILFLTLLDVSSQWGLLPLVVLCHWICSIATAWSMVKLIFFFWWSMTSCSKIIGNLKFKAPSFLTHHGKHHLSCCYTPCMPFPFISMLPIYSNRSRKSIAQKNHWKRARFDGEIIATDGDHEWPAGSRRNVSHS